MSFKESLINILGKRSVQYLLFWIVSFVFLVNYFTRGTVIGQIDLIYTILFHISLVFAVTTHSFYMVPQFLAMRRYAFYFTGVCLLIFTSVWLNIFTFRSLSDWLFPGYYFISYLEWWEILEFMVVYVGLTSLLEFSKSWFRELEHEKEMEILQKEKVKTELKALKAQINPHFLFNSLNHIYALASSQSPNTSEAVLQLSDLLRYALKSMKAEKVALRDEIEYLRGYIHLYRNRMHHPERILFELEGDPGDHTIAPLLLVVFVENCFKHGSTKQPDETIHIRMDILSEKIIFTTRNTVNTDRELPREEEGLGLENVRKRLQLLYPERHYLTTRLTDNTYNTYLELSLL